MNVNLLSKLEKKAADFRKQRIKLLVNNLLKQRCLLGVGGFSTQNRRPGDHTVCKKEHRMVSSSCTTLKRPVENLLNNHSVARTV